MRTNLRFQELHTILLGLVLSLLIPSLIYYAQPQDFWGYFDMYNDYPPIRTLLLSKFSFFSWGEVYGEFGYTFLNSALKTIGLDFYQTRYFIVCLVIFFKILWFYMSGLNIYYAVPLYFLLVFPDDFSLLRNAIATVFIPWAFLFLFKYRMPFVALTLILCGSVFHISAALGLIFLINSKRKAIISILISISILLMPDSLVALQPISYISSKLVKYFFNPDFVGLLRGSVFMALTTLLAYVVWSYTSKTSENTYDYIDNVFLVSVLSTSALVFLSFSQVLSDRIFGLFSMFNIGLISFLFSKCRPQMSVRGMYGMAIIAGFLVIRF